MVDEHRDMSGIDALHAQRERGFPLLRFQPELERGFHAYYRDSGRGFRLLLLCVAFAVVSSTPFYNELLGAPADFKRLILPITYAVELPALAIGILVTAMPRLRRYADPVLTAAAFILAIGLLAERAIGAVHDFDMPMEFVGIIIVAIFFIARLRFRVFFPVALALSALLVLNEVLLVIPVGDEWYRLVAVTILVGIAFVGGYAQEFLARSAWLQRCMLEHHSKHDSLTGLLNRRGVEEAADRALRQAARTNAQLAIAAVDLDYFKSYNDAVGHPSGDEFLRRLASMLQEAVRRPLDCVGRLGGEEFVIVWHDASPDEAERLAERLRCAVESMTHPETSLAPRMTISAGLVTLEPGRDAELSPLLQRADSLLYRAKDQGRNRIVAEHLGDARPVGSSPQRSVTVAAQADSGA